MDIGTKIKGIYLDEFEFAGIIEKKQSFYHGTFKYLIRLTPPIEVYGIKRETIIMTVVKKDGSPDLYMHCTNIEKIKEK